ncbi:polysaccharide deacetylase family protein [Nocardiopsis ansamitocini]|uniref:NodB homology domain-containing protein n=1 Tax=Nocardiopsis ansamitocini TaxID=1670832 RepID=A0A9W6P7R9_9ACTN|nr:polysaccharide deacetylase family protein [Nocardiopsis ansamitocini]GLU48577.1 hypothetical protein Nans01_29280 [Nocardiopsis ansamitocini]
MLSHSTSRSHRPAAAVAVATLCVLAACSTPAPEEALPPGLRLVSTSALTDLDQREEVVTADGIATTARYPFLPGAHPLTLEIRTTMAELETAFLSNGSKDATLVQETHLLAASADVMGARLVAQEKNGDSGRSNATTRWYDGRTKLALPWTALLDGEPAISELGDRVARLLISEHDVASDALPAGLSAPSSPASATPSRAASPSPSPVDATVAWADADKHKGSPLEDLGFTAAGDLVVSLSPGEVAGSDDVQITVPQSAGLLSEFGLRAQKSATGKAVLPVPGKEKAPTHTMDCSRVACVALTFDDGPGPDTALLLDHLAAYSAPATFYVLGELVADNKDVLRRATREGHELGNHTWKHDDLTRLSGKAVAADIARTSKAVREATGADTPTLRPPYGAHDANAQKHVGLPMIMWDVDTLDWQHRDSAKTVKSAIADTTPGSVVLFHDIHRPTVDAIPQVLRGLRAKGYHFVTVSHLFGGQDLAPGTAYNRLDRPTPEG